MLERLALLADEKAEAADIAAAIGALDPAAVTKDDAAALGALLARYNALSAEGQALVDNIDTLKAALARVQELTDKAMAAELTAKIAALPEEAALLPGRQGRGAGRGRPAGGPERVGESPGGHHPA